MANSTSSFLTNRLDSGSLPLAVGDFVVLIALGIIGTLNHHPHFLANNPMEGVRATVPFLIGWIVFAPIIGAYSAGAAESAKAAIPLAIRSWVPADILGIVIWAAIKGTFAIVGLLTFGLVMLFLGAIVLGAWRWVAFKIR